MVRPVTARQATSEHDYVARAHNYRTICHSVTRLLEASSYRTIEVSECTQSVYICACGLAQVPLRA